jgi:ABC-type antimicrobial peptide transport system permease subunit
LTNLGDVFRFVIKDLIIDGWRSLLTMISLAVVVVGYLLLASLAQSILVLTSPAQVSNNLLIVSANTIDPMDSSLDESILQTALEITPNQIQRAFPVIFRHLTIDGRIMQVRALPLEEMPTALALTLIQGEWPAGLYQVVVSEGAAQLASWKIGSSVNIYGTDFQVTGMVRSTENAFGSLWMTYTAGQHLFGSSRGFQVGFLVLAPSTNPESVRLRLLADPRISPNFNVYLENVFTNDYNQSTNNLLVLCSLMVLVSLLAITFGIYNATTLSLTERSIDIGLLRLIGFSLRNLRGFLFVRALILIMAAYGLGWVVSMIFIHLQRIQASVDIVFLSLRLTVFSSLSGLGLAVIFAFLGVWFTSRRLAGLKPMNGIK